MPSNFNPAILDFAYAYSDLNGKPEASATFRARPEDFVVTEELGFNPSGEGEHLLLNITKTSQNTAWVAQQIAKFAGVKPMDVGYCGRKDRHAVCRQWFSVYLPIAKSLNWDHWQEPGISINEITRHNRKLRPGDHQGNRFDILLRDMSNTNSIAARLKQVETGVPNYFGEQRFGKAGNNLRLAQQWASGTLKVRDKKQRGLYISALRSYLFNTVLSERVRLQNWREALPGDVKTPQATGPMWGRGRSLVTDATLEVEQAVLATMREWCDALEHCGLNQERRPLVCVPRDYSWLCEGNNLRVRFELDSGQFATSVLREIACLNNGSESN